MIGVLFFSEMGMQYFDSVTPVVLLDKGMDPNYYAFIGFISIVLEGGTGYLVSAVQNKEMTLFWYSFILRTLNNLFYLIIIMGY